MIAGAMVLPTTATLDLTVLPAETEPSEEYAITVTEISVPISLSVSVYDGEI